MQLEKPTIISLPKITDLRGNLSFLESYNHIPFDIKRAYWIYDVPGGEERGGHAYTNSMELILPLSGAFEVKWIQGEKGNTVFMNSPCSGLLLHPYTWRKVGDFITGSVCLVLSNTHFDECEYIYDFTEYSKVLKAKGDGINSGL